MTDGYYKDGPANLALSVKESESTKIFALGDVKPNNCIKFFNQEGEEVGMLDFNSDEVKFEGKADEAAKSFIRYLKLQWGMK